MSLKCKACLLGRAFFYNERVMGENMDIRIFGTAADSIVDGPGLRYAVFVQGCSHHCPGCHNPESQPFDGGTVRTVESVLDEIRANGLVRDVTLSGGEPFEQPEACAELARRLKEDGYGIWTYTGYVYEDLLRMTQDRPAIGQLLESTDVLVDGPFVQAKKSLMLKFRGSSNQRIIDVSKTREAGAIVLWQRDEEVISRPASW